MNIKFNMFFDITHWAVCRGYSLSSNTGLSVYDAAGLVLAMQAGLPLTPRDKAPGEAARRARVELLL